jgi:hypothetical protein
LTPKKGFHLPPDLTCYGSNVSGFFMLFQIGKDFVHEVDYLIQITLFANRVTTPSNCAYSPSQLACGVDMIFRQKILIDWIALKQVRCLQAVANNAKENKKWLGHIYKVDDLVLIVKKPYELAKADKISLPTYSKGPYKIIKLYMNGMVKIQRGSFLRIIYLSTILCLTTWETDNQQ